MIDVLERLKETNNAIAAFRHAGIQVPDGALEIKEVMERCVRAEHTVVSTMLAAEPTATAMQLDREAYEAYARQVSRPHRKDVTMSNDVQGGSAAPASYPHDLLSRIRSKMHGFGPGYLVSVSAKPGEWQALLDAIAGADPCRDGCKIKRAVREFDD